MRAVDDDRLVPAFPQACVFPRIISDAQGIVVASGATGQQGNEEGEILRNVFWHSLALAPAP